MSLEVRELSFRYRGQAELFDGLSFSVGPGVCGLVGVNGAGKTTLLKLIAGLLKPPRGGVHFQGSRILASQIGYVPQSFVPPRGLTVEEFLAYVCWLRAVPRRDRRDRIGEALEQVELEENRRAKVVALSGGMQRRLLLSQALVASPEILLLDEPTTGLDPEQRVRVREIVNRLGQTCAVLMSSHVMEDVEQVALKVLMIDSGALVYDGDIPELRALGKSLVQADSGLSELETAFLYLRTRQGAAC